MICDASFGQRVKILAKIAPHSPRAFRITRFLRWPSNSSVINLLPRAEVELAIGYRHNYLMTGAS